MLLDTTPGKQFDGASAAPLAAAEKIEIVSDPARFLQLKPHWDALWARSLTGGVFQSFDTCLNIWQTVALPAGRKLFCLIGWEGEHALAIWPLTTFRQYAWRCLRPLEASGAEYTDLLLDPRLDAARWLNTAWGLIQRKSQGDVMILPYVKAGTPLRDCLLSLSKNPLVDQECGVFAELRQEKDWESYYASLSGTLRKKHRNIRRKIEKIGELRLETIAAGDPRCPALIDWLLAEKRIWTERSHKSGPWVETTEYRDFLVRLLSDPNTTPKTFLFTLHAGDILLGVKMGTSGKSLSEALVAAFSAEHEKQSPGVILDEYYVHWAFDQQLDCDFGNGAERNKLFWTRHATVETATFTIPLSLWGLTYLRARTWARNRRQGKESAAPAHLSGEHSTDDTS